jgi:hypothetical protein
VTSSFELRLKSMLQTCSFRRSQLPLIDWERRARQTHLTARIHLLQQIPRQGIPEPQLLIRRSSSASKDTVLMRVPGDSFDGGDVVGEAVERLLSMSRRVSHGYKEREGRGRTSFILSKTNNLLSFPPLANCPSALHFSPHTSCLCTANLCVKCSLIRTSRWRMRRSCEPEVRTWSFQARAPTVGGREGQQGSGPEEEREVRTSS